MAQAEQDKIQSLAFVISAWLCVGFSAAVAMLGIAAFEQSGEVRLDGKINPNDAEVVSLVRLPGIGFGRAGAIVAFREDSDRDDSNGPAFSDCNDLQNVKGIGPKIAQRITEWLKFD